MPEQKIQKADVRARHNALWVIAIALVLVGALALAFGNVQQQLQAWIARRLDEPGGIESTLLAISIFAILPLLVAGVYLYVLGSRCVRARRFPPPGLAVLLDTQVMEGAAGLRRGRLLQGLAVIFIAVALLVPFVMWRVTQSLLALG